MSFGRAFILLLVILIAPLASAATTEQAAFPTPVESYADDATSGIVPKLAGRVAADPFNLVATVIFLLAITHTFLASSFMRHSHKFERDLENLEAGPPGQRVAGFGKMRDKLRFRATAFHFLGEVEAIFGIWLIPLAFAIMAFKGWGTMIHYFDKANYTEPIFVFVVMAVASSKPILRCAEGCLGSVAKIGGGTPVAWWLSILTLGPLLGSFITEPAAMTICALLLVERFYKLQPSMRLRYATLALLFVNVSVGGTLSHFAAPPVVMVAAKWNWGFTDMLFNFGWKAVIGIILTNVLFFGAFRKELLGLKGPAREETRESPIPLFITLVHLLIICWTVLNSHHPALVIFGLLFFLAFAAATDRHQDTIALRGPLLVGFFLAALVIHGGCQQWWIAPVLSDLGRWPLMIGATLLTALNDNAAITYLATLVPGFTEPLKYAVVAGAVTGGGLTVIANAPNPAGQSILQKYFGEDGINPLGLFLAALIPTVIMGAAFMLLP